MSQISAKLTEETYRGYSGSGIDEKIILSVGAGLIDWLMILSMSFYSYHFVRAILSIPFCPMTFCPYTILPIPFCPYHFVCYHFVLEPSEALPTQHGYCAGFSRRRATGNWVKDLPKISTWRLKRKWNPWLFGRKSSTLPMRYTRPIDVLAMTTESLSSWFLLRLVRRSTMPWV